MSNDLISRQAAIEINRSYHGQMPNEVNHRIWKEINELPSAQPGRTGKWIKETKHHKDQFQEFDYYTIKCSVCGSAPEKNWHLTPYCPHCGCKMEMEQDEYID